MPLEDSPPLVKVHLYGILAEKYGTPHEFGIRTPVEAVRALDANFPGFVADFKRYERYIIIADDDEQREGDEAAYLPVSHDLHLIPQIEGQAFIGAAIFTALIPGIGTFTATLLGTLLFAGIAIGLSFLLRPKKKEQKEEPKDESYAFSGPENVAEQGVAVPLVYGRVFVGSVVVSAGMSVAEIPIT